MTTASAARAACVAAAIGFVALLAGCDDGVGVQSMLYPRGEGARRIAGLWWAMFAMGAAIYVAVLGLLGWGLFRRRRGQREPRPARATLWIGVGGLLVPAVVLTAVLVLTLGALAREAAAERGANDLVVTVTGKQWWWNVEYEHEIPQRRLRTANEIHIPVGRRVRVHLQSHDVIHSFWVPNLQGMTDLVPGRRNVLYLHADRPGVYRGQCTEYCGMQHARMSLVVIAQPQAEFDAWYERSLRPAAPPTDTLARQGERVFREKPCALCHAVRGTDAHATAGPDLTHLASRLTLAAGVLPNERGHLAGWIVNPQRIKPGSHMPNIDLEAWELHALLAYLEGLR